MSLVGNLKNSDGTFILKWHLSEFDIASSVLNAKLSMWKKRRLFKSKSNVKVDKLLPDFGRKCKKHCCQGNLREIQPGFK